MDVHFQKWLFLIQRSSKFRGIEFKNRAIVFENPGNEVEVAQDMLFDSLDQGSLICLGYAYFFSIPEPEYAYKRYAYKKTCGRLVLILK